MIWNNYVQIFNVPIGRYWLWSNKEPLGIGITATLGWGSSLGEVFFLPFFFLSSSFLVVGKKLSIQMILGSVSPGGERPVIHAG